MDNPIAITLLIIASGPIYLSLMSFLTWENAFRILGFGFTARCTIAMLALFWICFAITRYSGA
ncbi:Uncharacterised protein [Serratia ficaria]|nr:Uncharacterised protein [Serratia ficaria]CAI1770070.1 Uncharacterised protein [Serratia ficaria]CAI2464906.1 Uncharacterised protein [Serratia ficaria]